MSSVVILHGAWHSPGHWKPIVDRLTGEGMRVFVPDLGGMSIQEARSLVQGVVNEGSEPPLLIAHSNGGIVGSRIEGTLGRIFIGAWILQVGETPQSIIADVTTRTGRQLRAIPIVTDDRGRTTVDPAGAREALYADCDKSTAAWATELLRPEPAAIFSAAVSEAPELSDAVYVGLTKDNAIDPALSQHFQELFPTVLSWATSHSPYLSQPELVIDIVRQKIA